MTIEDFHPAMVSVDTVCLGETSLIFPSSLVKHKQLEGYDFVRIGVDPDRQRVFFAFEFEPSPDLLRFTNQTERTLNKVIPALELYAAYEWIEKIAIRADPNTRRFVLQDVDPSDIRVFRKYKHYIELK